MAPEVRVEPVVLEAAANVAADLRAGLGKDLVDVEPETTQVARELGGWLTGKAMGDLLHWCQDDLTKLKQRLDAMSDGLKLCARDYRQTDHASAENFRAMG